MTNSDRDGFLQGGPAPSFSDSMKPVAPCPAAPCPAAVPLVKDLVAELRDRTVELRAWRLALDTRQTTDTADQAFRRARALATQTGKNNAARTVPQHPEKTARR